MTIPYHVVGPIVLVCLSHMDTGKIYNYVDDNTLSCSGSVVNDVISDLEEATESVLRWFEINGLQTDPDKFHVMILNGTFRLIYWQGHIPSNPVKLLGVHINDHLNLNQHTYAETQQIKAVKDSEHLELFYPGELYCPLVLHEF